jgi:hypothetical protein
MSERAMKRRLRKVGGPSSEDVRPRRLRNAWVALSSEGAR